MASAQSLEQLQEEATALRDEVSSLKDKLQATEESESTVRHQMDMQKKHTKQLMAAWKLRLQEGEDKLHRQKLENDKQLRDIAANLMFLEGQFQKEQKVIVGKLKHKDRLIEEKDRIIEQQQKTVEALKAANDRLVHGLSQLRLARGGGLENGGPSVEPRQRTSNSKSLNSNHKFQERALLAGPRLTEENMPKARGSLKGRLRSRSHPQPEKKVQRVRFMEAC
ncbi:RASAL2 [Branchiostoma lanceolatum]|uniref:RASAL2 protein n=1 Tax=Branchiostoma lanceolatum TaxID=7740 RepID=A0A8K0F265_BRALA|nr:RASAL2 [Branchiostoma lanceolatum]